MAENGSASFPISLRPRLNENDGQSEDLMSKIRLINQQRDGFRNVTEEELLAEINEGKDAAQDGSESEEEDEDDAQRGTLESVFVKRGSMVRSLGYV
jgi:mediator of RNA polymerase II transcription subunit 17